MPGIESSPGFCLICFEFLQQSNDLVKIKSFIRLLESWGPRDSFNKQLRVLHEKKIPHNLVLDCCDNCHQIVKNICEVNSKIKRLNVQLNTKLDKIARIIEVTETIHSGKRNRSVKLLNHIFGDRKKNRRICHGITNQIRSRILNSCCRKFGRSPVPRLPKRNRKLVFEQFMENDVFEETLAIDDADDGVVDAVQFKDNVANAENALHSLVEPKIERADITDNNLSDVSIDNPFFVSENTDNHTSSNAQAQINHQTENDTLTVNLVENEINTLQTCVQPSKPCALQSSSSFPPEQNKHGTGLKKLTCYTCDGVFISEKALDWHSWHIHFKRRIPCTVCLTTCPSQTALNQHMETHKNPEDWKWQCEVCSKKLITKSQLKQHRKIHFLAPGNPVENQLLKKLSNGSPQSSKTKTGLPPSTSLSLENENKKITDDLNLNKISCDTCGKQFKSVRALGMHINFVHPKVQWFG